MAFSMGDVQVAIRQMARGALTTDMKTVDLLFDAKGQQAAFRRQFVGRLRAIFSGSDALNRGDAGDYQVKSR